MRLSESQPRTSTLSIALIGVGFVAALSLLAAACSSSSKPSVSAGQPATGATVLSRATSSGRVLTDAAGKPLYTFANDQPGATTSSCTGGCATAWPPLMVGGTPTAGPGVTGNLAKLASGQVTWDGHPLYTFTSDSAGGNPSGDGVNGFHLAMATGTNAGTTATTSTGGYNY